MKNNTILAFIAASILVASCNNNANTKNAKDSAAIDSAKLDSMAGLPPDTPKRRQGKATITFEKKSYDFGKVKETEKVTHEFKFTNNGIEPLIIENASASCGCTVPDYSKEPIAPGKSGSVKVMFDPTGQSGKVNKVVTVTANTTPETTEVYLIGEVIGKPGKKAPAAGDHEGHEH